MMQIVFFVQRCIYYLYYEIRAKKCMLLSATFSTDHCHL